MNEKIEGTFLLEGLIEGQLSNVVGIEEDLQAWTTQAKTRHLPVSLEIDGGSFSVLGLADAVPAKRLGDNPSETVLDEIQALADLFSEQSSALFSTLRSIEYRPNQEVQTIYSIDAAGNVSIQDRTLDARTTAPPERMSVRQAVRLGATGLVVALVFIGVTSFFIDYRGLLENTFGAVVPIDTKSVVVETENFSRYLTAKLASGQGGKHGTLMLIIGRTAQFPTSPDALEAERISVDTGSPSIGTRLAFDALARGYVRIELFDEKDHFVGFNDVRIRDLSTQKSVNVLLVVPKARSIRRIRLSY